MNELLEIVAHHDDLADLDPASRRLALRELFQRELDATAVPQAVAQVANAIDSFGPLTPLMTDPEVTDVLVNGPSDVWIERDGRLERTAFSFGTIADLHTFIRRLTLRAGIRVDTSRPIADGRLPDGSRLHVVLPPLAPRGPLLSIRRFPERALRLGDLISSEFATADQTRCLVDAVRSRRTIAISGGTGTGKTTLLNALLSEIGPQERVVVIEETAELHPTCSHWASLLARARNVEGEGQVTLDDLVRASLRMRPDRIVVGEVRGPEAHTALAAMSVGHAGSLVTVHARSSADVIDRLVSLALTHPARVSEPALRRQVEAALDVAVHVGRDARGRRKILELSEIR